MLNLVYAGNSGVFDGWMISCLSLAETTEDAVTVYMLTMDYTDANPRYTPVTERDRAYVEEILKGKNPESRAVLLDMGELYRTHLAGNPNEENSYTPYTLLRLLLDRVEGLPDKLLYLDTDTVFADDAARLYEIDLGACEAAVVRDYYGRHFFGHNYFNAGVLLLNMKELRKTGALSRAAARCRKKKIFLSDQTALNREIRKKKMLPSRYNEQHKLRDDTVIRHFSMTIRWFPKIHPVSIKPWNVEQVREVLGIHAFDGILDDYLARKAAREKEIANEK